MRNFLIALLLLPVIAYGATVTESLNGNDQITYDSLSANGISQGEAINALAYNSLSAQYVWANHSDTSDVELQVSNDGGTNYDTITGSTFTTVGASGSTTIDIPLYAHGRMRLAVTEADGNAASTVVLFVIAKRWNRHN